MSHYNYNSHFNSYEPCGGIFEIENLHQSAHLDDDYGFYEDFESVEEDPRLVSYDSNNACNPCYRIVDQQENLDVSPPILNSSMVEQIVSEGLPWSMQDMKWDRLFSSTRDGPSFGTFMRKVRGCERTIVVAKASDGRIVGGFATEPWSGKKKKSEVNLTSNHHAFLFSVFPAKKDSAKPLVQPSSSSRTSFVSFIPCLKSIGGSPTSALDFDLAKLSLSPNDGNHVDISKQHDNVGFKQVCQLSNKFIAMGDGQDVCLSIGDSFSRGSASTSSANRNEFDIVHVEVYGFSEGLKGDTK